MCPCFANNRECDVDLCKGCKRNSKKECCQNMKIFFKNSLPTQIGKSKVCDGLGLFSITEIKKDQFIMEYTGH